MRAAFDHNDEREGSSALSGPSEPSEPSSYVWLSCLRAFGLVLVLVYHFVPEILPGGFLGVDVFFVFSGFLITSLLLREARKNRSIKLMAFYERRWRRLFPAVLSMLLITLPLSLLLSPDFRAGLFRQVAAVLAWTTNYYEIFSGASYAGQLLPQLYVHTWTLSIEMQYYLVWGLVISWLAPRLIERRRSGLVSTQRLDKAVGLLAAGLALGSFVAMQLFMSGALGFATDGDFSRAYFDTLSHSYPLLLGSFLGVVAGFPRTKTVCFLERLSPRLALTGTVLALGVIFVLAVFLSFEDPLTFRFGIAVTALCTTAVIALGRGMQSRLAQYREPAVLKYLADRSYSLYLFHWPVYIVFNSLGQGLAREFASPAKELVGALFLISALAVTFAAAHLSYRFVEQFFRVRRVEAPDNHPPASRRSSRVRQTSAETSARVPVKASARTDSRRFSSPTAWSRPVSSTAVSVLAALMLLGGSSFALATAPAKTSIELDYQSGYLALDRAQLEARHPGQGPPSSVSPEAAQDRENAAFPEAGDAVGPEASSSGSESAATNSRTEIRTQMAARVAAGQLAFAGGISIIGDSVTLSTIADLQALVGPAAFDAEVGRGMYEGIDLVGWADSSGTLGEYVVIALAFNSHANSYDAADLIAASISPGHRIVFVTSYGVGGHAELSAYLRTLEQSYAYVTIADWAQAIEGKDHLLAEDHYHPATPQACEIFAQTIADALAEASLKPSS